MVNKKYKRIPRKNSDLIESLRFHVKQLRGDYQKMLTVGPLKFAGEVTSRLRLLVCRTNTNKPLLLNLLKKNNDKIIVKKEEFLQYIREGEDLLSIFKNKF